MSYWSLRRVAERAAAGHELARTGDSTGHLMAPAAPAKPTHDAFGVEMVRPVVEPHPVTVSPRRSLRQRAAELEQAIWIVPSPDPADADPLVPGPVRVKARSRW
ncbi:hypothetical protein acdb102_45700 [Acidothermaceae bacterium B102]|nr:hypothetical protein acdb102_45700 [Acidothermaceae bacterium B102]